MAHSIGKGINHWEVSEKNLLITPRKKTYRLGQWCWCNHAHQSRRCSPTSSHRNAWPLEYMCRQNTGIGHWSSCWPLHGWRRAQLSKEHWIIPKSTRKVRSWGNLRKRTIITSWIGELLCAYYMRHIDFAQVMDTRQKVWKFFISHF